MRTVKTLTLEEAEAVVGHIIAMAKTDGGKPVAVAVVGMDGRLIAFAAMDGVLPVSTQYAQDKAYTSWVFRRDTIEFRGRPMTNFPDPRITNFAGGVVVRDASDETVGGIGVSGRKSCLADLPEAERASTTVKAQDHELAQEGLRIVAHILTQEVEVRS